MRRLLALALLLIGGPAWAASAPAFLDVTLQGHAVGQAVEFDRDGSTLTAPTTTWAELGVLLRPGETGDLSTVQLGFSCTIDDLKQAVACSGPADRFPIQQTGPQRRPAAPLSPSVTGVLLGYDLAVASHQGQTVWSTSPTLRVLTPWGRLESTGQLDANQGWRSGFTTFTKEWADKRLVLQAGDITPDAIASIPTAMMRGVRFGSDPALDPMDPTYPIPVIGGVAVADSKIDAYLNARPIGQVGQVGQGGFALGNPQVGPGANTMDLVLTDAYGRQTTITNQFYIAPSLLRPGLSRWDVNIGRTRTSGESAVAGSWARGLSDTWTLQGSVQATATGHNLAAGALVGGLWGTAGLTVGASSGGGRYWSAQYAYTTDRWSVGVGRTQASDTWWDLAPDARTPRRQDTAFASYRINSHLSLSATAARVAERDGTRRTRADLRLSGSTRSLNWSLDFEHQNGRGNSVMAFVSIPLGRTMQASIQRDDESVQANLNGHWDGPVSGNWSATASHENGVPRTLGTLSIRTPTIQNDTSVSTGPGGLAISNVVSGDLWLGTGGIQSVPPVYDGFAVVEVGVPGVRVYLENRLMGRTGKNGSLVISPLTSLVPNQIRIASEDLPLGVDVSTPTMIGVPNRRGGARVVFTTSGGLAREFRVVTDAGDDVPARTTVGDTMVGTGGVLYLDKAIAGSILTLTPPTGAPCAIRIPQPLPPFSEIARLTCSAQK